MKTIHVYVCVIILPYKMLNNCLFVNRQINNSKVQFQGEGEDVCYYKQVNGW